MQLENTTIKNHRNIDSFDWGWLVISFGMALGAGVVMVPITIGVYGLKAFMICAIFAYPAIYLFQRLYINSLFGTAESKCYSENISSQLGNKFGTVLSVIYFLMMAIWTIIYAELSCKSIYTYLFPCLQLHGLANYFNFNTLSLFIIILLVIIGCKSQKILFKVSSIIAMILLAGLILAAALVLPQWNILNAFHPVANHCSFLSAIMTMFPFALTTILFLQSLSPMVMAYRDRYSDLELARKKSNYIMGLAFSILLVIILFYIVSFSGIIPTKSALVAQTHNDSVFTLLATTNNSSELLQYVGGVINFCAVLAAFLSIISGMRESLRGILLNVKKHLIRDGAKQLETNTSLELLIALLIVLITWLPIVTHWSIYRLVPLCGPIFGIVGCLVPVYLVIKTPSLARFKGPSLYYITFIGIILCLSPLF